MSMWSTEQRRAGRVTFTTAAAQYDATRPRYPEALYDELIRASGINEHSWLLEMGCGPGIATEALAARGFRITALDIGDDMVSAAQRNLAPYPRVEVCNGDFETWDPGDRGPFDLVYASTAWHWVEPDARYTRAASLLRPGGHLAFWAAEHVFPKDGDPFFRDIQYAYDQLGDSMPTGYTWPEPFDLPDRWTEEVTASGLFDEIHCRQFAWNVDYDVDQYLALIDTFSSNLLRSPADKAYLYGEIRRRVAERDDPLLHRAWGSALFVARRK